MADLAPPIRKRRTRGRKRGIRFRCGGCAFAGFLAIALGSVLVWWQSTPPSTSLRPVLVHIPSRTGAAGTANLLQRAGVIRNATVFLWYSRLRGEAGRFHAGDYRLSPSYTADEIITRLRRGGGDSEAIAITVPEGWTLKQIASALEQKGILRDGDAFLAMVKSTHPPLKAPFALPNIGIEGYLFPDTYRFTPNAPPENVAQAMLDRFTTAFFDKRRADIERSDHTLHEIVTIASLVEREAKVERDRARIAGVIENRLRNHMRLDIDATVLYALGHHKERVLYKDLEVASPYNTYRHKGLPPGPIASPGIPSLEAALNPEKHGFLYYVASPDGSHVFTRTEAEHNAAVARIRAMRSSK